MNQMKNNSKFFTGNNLMNNHYNSFSKCYGKRDFWVHFCETFNNRSYISFTRRVTCDTKAGRKVETEHKAPAV